jgi:hypothetical protein
MARCLKGKCGIELSNDEFGVLSRRQREEVDQEVQVEEIAPR